MASDLQCNLIGRDFCVEFLGIALRLGIEVGEVEPGAPRGAGEMVAEVPVARAAPDKLGHLVAEGEALAAARGGTAAPGEAIAFGLLGGDLRHRAIITDRSGGARATREAVS